MNPIVCVSCNKYLSPRFPGFAAGVARYAAAGHPSRYLLSSGTTGADLARLLWRRGDAGADTRTAEGRALDELGVARECCRRHFLSLTDFHTIRAGAGAGAVARLPAPRAPAPVPTPAAQGGAPAGAQGAESSGRTPEPAPSPAVVTLTFCERGENHAGMQMVTAGGAGGSGDAGAAGGFSVADLERAKTHAEQRLGLRARLVRLDRPEVADGLPEAAVLVIEGFVPDLPAALAEALALAWDRKYYDTRRRRVLNKVARANLVFADHAQEPDYENRKGTVVDFRRTRHVAALRARVGGFGPKFAGLVAEGNRYDDGGRKKNGIGFHGDSERTRVFGVRLGPDGASMPLHFQWYDRRKPVGARVTIPLNNGDAYVMSAKAVGTDWKRWTVPTLRHATGAPKYTEQKTRTKKKKTTKKKKPPEAAS